MSPQTTEVLSLATQTWSHCPYIPNGIHYCCGSSSVGNSQANLYLVGGLGSVFMFKVLKPSKEAKKMLYVCNIFVYSLTFRLKRY